MKLNKIAVAIASAIACTAWAQDVRQGLTNIRSDDLRCETEISGGCQKMSLRASEHALLELERQMISSGHASPAQLQVIASARLQVALAASHAERLNSVDGSRRCAESVATHVPPIL